MTHKSFLSLAAPAFVSALLVNACATNLRVTDTSGRTVSLDTPHVAERHISEGEIVVYANTTDDINQLIRQLQQLGVTDQQILRPEAWSQALCGMGGKGKCSGHCPTGACKLVGLKSETRQVAPTQWKNIAVPLKWCQCVTLANE
jgi:hypothetical protein